MKKTVFFVDDHPLVLTGLQAALARIPGIEVEVARTANAAEVRLGKAPRPHLTLLDITLGDGSAFSLLEKLRSPAAAFTFAILTSSRDWNHLKKAMQYGAQGFLSKEADTEALTADIQALLRGEKKFPNAELPPRQLPSDLIAAFHTLTDREKELLKYIKAGYLNREIAGLMGISVRTVESHRAAAAAKLGAQSGIQLSTMVLELGPLLD